MAEIPDAEDYEPVQSPRSSSAINARGEPVDQKVAQRIVAALDSGKPGKMLFGVLLLALAGGSVTITEDQTK
jgi:hypothetical protein